MDAGMNIATGASLRTALLAAHGGETFREFLRLMVHGAQTIPHGIEEMAWDLYLQQAGWPTLLPLTLFSVHRSLLAGRDCDSPFADLVVASTAEHELCRRKEEVDLGRVKFGVSLPTCRHSHVLDCGEDSLLAKSAGSKGKGSGQLKRPRALPKQRREDDVENCNKCGKDTLPSNQLLLCDGAGCSRTFHQLCLSPPLDVVPEGDWLCPSCADPTQGAVLA